MSTKHLGQGSTFPPKTEGKWRLYSMAYCPYAQRALLVLILKQVPYEIVNIDLKNKPDWFLKISPTGKVPLLDTGSELVTESLDICDFIDKKYPNPPLYGPDVAKDKQLIEKFDPLIKLFFKPFYKKDNTPLKHYLDQMKPHLQALETELKERGTFFGGKEPKMPDYVIWPWADRATVFSLIYEQQLPFEDLQIPLILKWCKAMKELKVIKDSYIDPQLYYRLSKLYASGEQFSYDDF